MCKRKSAHPLPRARAAAVVGIIVTAVAATHTTLPGYIIAAVGARRPAVTGDEQHWAGEAKYSTPAQRDVHHHSGTDSTTSRSFRVRSHHNNKNNNRAMITVPVVVMEDFFLPIIINALRKV